MIADDRRSIGDLLGELTSEAQLLLQQEITLAKQELGEMAQSTLRGILLFAAAAVCGLVVLIALVVFLIMGLGYLLGGYYALTGLGLAIIFAAIAGLLAWMGKRRLQIHLPERTIASLREDVEWAKAQLRRVQR